jgi:hypothetical protein
LGNNLLGELRLDRGALPHLTVLDLEGDRLDARCPTCSGDAAGLAGWLEPAKLAAGVHRLAALPAAAEALTNNKIALLPRDLGRLVALRELLLSGNRLQRLPESLGRLQQLKRLTVSENPALEDRRRPSLGNAQGLRHLRLHAPPPAVPRCRSAAVRMGPGTPLRRHQKRQQKKEEKQEKQDSFRFFFCVSGGVLPVLPPPHLLCLPPFRFLRRRSTDRPHSLSWSAGMVDDVLRALVLSARPRPGPKPPARAECSRHVVQVLKFGDVPAARSQRPPRERSEDRGRLDPRIISRGIARNKY